MHSTGYILRFVFIMTAIVALVLALLSTALSDVHKRNEAIFNKRAILSAVIAQKELAVMSDDEVLNIFDSKMEQIVLSTDGNLVTEDVVEAAGYKGGKAEHIDMAKEKKKPVAKRILPLFVYNSGNGKIYITTVRGNGLWDEIWGYIALKDDFNTIVGAAFDHKGETPGLGAEIKDNPIFPAQFKGKTLYTDGQYTSVVVRKGGAKDKRFEVDGISGATVTCDGVTTMLKKGLQYYQTYFDTLKKK